MAPSSSTGPNQREPIMRPQSASPVKTWLLALGKVAVSLLLLGFLARSLDLSAVAGTLTRLPLPPLLAACVLLIVQTLVLGFRWWMVMEAVGTRLPLQNILPMTFIGVFFNQVLPTSFGGDAVRMYQVTRLGVTYDGAIIGVLLERAGGVLGLTVLVALGVWATGNLIDDAWLRYGLIAVLPLAFFGAGMVGTLDRLPERWRRWRLLRDLARLATDSRRVFFSPGIAVPLLLISLLSHTLFATAAYVLAEGLGLGIGFWACLALVSTVILITMIPVSFAGWGLREGAMVALLAFAGVGAPDALALSILIGLVMLAASLPGALFWAAQRRQPDAAKQPLG